MRYVLILIIILLTIYAPVELTNHVLHWWYDFGVGFDWELFYEMIVIWVCYISAILILMKWSRER